MTPLPRRRTTRPSGTTPKLTSTGVISCTHSTLAANTPLRVLMVTGAYHPDISSGGLQSRLMASALRGTAIVRVLTTGLDASAPRHSTLDGVEVTRIHLADI